MTTEDEKLIFKCFSCKKNYEKDFNKELGELLKLKHVGEYYDLCIQSDTFPICTRISMASMFKKNRFEIRIINRF